MSLVAVLLCSTLSLSGIAWESTFDGAMERARAENKPVFIAVNMDGEEVCAEIVENHYRDPGIVALSASFVCLFASKYFHEGGIDRCPRAGNIPCVRHQQVEIAVREKVLHIPRDELLVAPNHFFLGPDGKMLLSVAYMLTPGELEWCMKEALCRVDPAFEWTLRPSAMAPRGVRYGDRTGSPGREAGRPLTPEGLDDLEAQIQKSPRREQARLLRAYFTSLILTEGKKAMLLTRKWLDTTQRRTGSLLHEIGRLAPPGYWEVAADFLSHDDRAIRNEAVVALEQLAAPASLKALKRQKSVEKDEKIEANLIRAIAAAGRGDQSAASLVLKAAAKERNLLIRINAVIALIHVEDRERVKELLVDSLVQEAPGLRAAAAYALAVRRELELAPALEAALSCETDEEARTGLEAAKAVLQGGDLKAVNILLKTFALDTVERDRGE